jgi:hypothetical protein
VKLLAQKLKDGAMEVLEVPEPVLGQGMILVRNHYSLISAGTESSTVSAARKGLLGKIQERPRQAKQVLDVLLRQGPVQACRTLPLELMIDVANGLNDINALNVLHDLNVLKVKDKDLTPSITC